MMPSRKYLKSVNSYNKQITPQELAFNNWYYENMLKYDLLSDYDDSNVVAEMQTQTNDYIYSGAYEEDKTLAIKYLQAGKELPEDLANRLLIAKEYKEKHQI